MCMILSAHLHTENMHIVLETHIYARHDFSRMTRYDPNSENI